LSKLECYDWLVFTSVNAVEIVFDRIAREEKIATTMQSLFRSADRERRPKIAVIGPKTAEALQAYGITPDFVPDEYVAESILPGLGDLRGRWVLLPRAEIARKTLPEAIAEAGGIPHEIAIYQTVPVEPNTEGLAALKAGLDWITFTSPSTVHNFVEILRRQKMNPFQLTGNPKIACIGPITEQAAREEGFEIALVAREYTTAGLVNALHNA
jgi:uroporphyrinogen-III synthase